MASTINASTSGAGGVITTADASGVLNIQTASTTAMTINSSQVVNFANTPTIAGSAFPSGAMTLISTQTANNSSDLIWSGLSGYSKYLLVCSNLVAQSNGAYHLLVGTGAGPTYITSGYYCVGGYADAGGTIACNSTYFTSGSYLLLNNGGDIQNQAGTVGLNGSFLFENVNSGYMGMVGNYVYKNHNLNNFTTGFVSGGLTTSNTLTAIKITYTTPYSGTASLYGISS